MYKEYRDCEILNVYRRIMANSGNLNEYLIQIRMSNEKSVVFDYFNIKIDKSNLYQELMEMVEGKRKRVYASHGMTDIDIFKTVDKYCIEWSPDDATYVCFYFEKENFVNCFVNALK